MDTAWHGRRYWQNRKPKERVENLFLPSRLASVAWDDLKPSRAEWLQKWMEGLDRHVEAGEGLYLVGDDIHEASKAAAIVLREAVSTHPLGGYYIRATDLADLFQDAAKGDDSGDEWPTPYLLRYLQKEFDLLVIDGFGEERNTDFTTHSMRTLVSHRYDHMLPTIFVTTLTQGEIPLRYEQAQTRAGDKMALEISGATKTLTFR